MPSVSLDLRKIEILKQEVKREEENKDSMQNIVGL